jgi:L-rhamnose mutarotase
MKEVSSIQKSTSNKENNITPLKNSNHKIDFISLLRSGFKMKLKSGCKAEYKKRHDAIWPELTQVLKNAGVSDYSIFLDEETNTLFACQKLTPNHTSDKLPTNPIVRKWWDYMSDIMEYNDKNEPQVTELNEMFHMK